MLKAMETNKTVLPISGIMTELNTLFVKYLAYVLLKSILRPSHSGACGLMSLFVASLGDDSDSFRTVFLETDTVHTARVSGHLLMVSSQNSEWGKSEF